MTNGFLFGVYQTAEEQATIKERIKAFLSAHDARELDSGSGSAGLNSGPTPSEAA